MIKTLTQNFKNIVHKYQSIIATKKYSYPSRHLILIGVTGTDGKTTVSTMISHVLSSAGRRVGYISTINAMIGDKILDTGLHVTTPDPWDIPKYLDQMVRSNIEFAVLESTSSGLDQHRLFGLTFDSSVVTNIKSDHLDYHKTWQKYAIAKYKLIEMTKDTGRVVLNRDDEVSYKWLMQKLKESSKEILSMSINDISNKKSTVEGISFKYKNIRFELPVIGKHNFMNALQTIELCHVYLPLEIISKALSTYKPPEGRMQILLKHPFTVIVDFAHTPDALKSALRSLRDIRKGGTRIITVFGCAGKRDKGRRKMGKVSANLSDITILTSEDPRDELLFDINSEIYSYANGQCGDIIARFKNHNEYKCFNLKDTKAKIDEVLANKRKPFISFDQDNISSRRDAIDFALKLANNDDIVFITGKGHEKSLSFGKYETEYEWSDQECIRDLLNLH